MTTKSVPGPAPKVDPAWRLTRLAHSPVIAGQTVVCVFQSGELRAYDGNAKPVWKFRLPGAVDIGGQFGWLLPTDSRILTQIGEELFVLDVSSGSLVASRRMAGSFLLKNAAAASGLLYLETVGTTGPYTLRAHDISSGRDASTATVDQGPSEYVLAGGMLCALSVDRGAISGLDPATGKRAWQTSVEAIGREFVPALQRKERGRVVGAIQLVDRLLVAGVYVSHIVAIDSVDGKIQWQTKVPMPAPVNCTPTPAGRIDALANGAYVSLDSGSGRVAQKARLKQAPMGVGTDPGELVFDGPTLYAAEESGTVFAFDTATGRVEWAHSVGAEVPLSLPPRLGVGRLFVTDFPAGGLHAFVLR
jgi:outer membrane protein assembly factor BamB